MENQVQNTDQLFNITKSYEGYPSKNNDKYSSSLTLEQAKDEMYGLHNLWKRTGMIIEKTDTTLVVEEGNGETRITFEIVEA